MIDQVLEPIESRPPEINRATLLLLASMLMGLARSFLDWQHLQAVGGGSSSAVSTMLFVFVLNSFLIWKMHEGRNWARITFGILFVLGLIPYAFVLLSESHRSMGWTVFELFQAALQLYAMILVFTAPGKKWFSPRPVSP